MIAPIGVSVCADHSVDVFFRPEERMVAHVKPMSSHHFAAGTPKCTTPCAVDEASVLRRDRRCGPRSPGRWWQITASTPTSIGMPNASHAQLREPDRARRRRARERRRHARERQRHPRLRACADRARSRGRRAGGPYAIAQFRLPACAAGWQSVADERDTALGERLVDRVRTRDRSRSVRHGRPSGGASRRTCAPRDRSDPAAACADRARAGRAAPTPPARCALPARRRAAARLRPGATAPAPMVLAASASRHWRASSSAGDRFFAGSALSVGNSFSTLAMSFSILPLVSSGSRSVPLKPSGQRVTRVKSAALTRSASGASVCRGSSGPCTQRARAACTFA